MQKFKAIFLLFSLLPFYGFAQIFYPVNQDYQYFIESSVKDSFTHHSAIKPFYLNRITLDSSEWIGNAVLNKKHQLQPIVNADIGAGGSILSYNMSTGANLTSVFASKIFVRVGVTANFINYPDFYDQFVDSNRVMPLLGRYDKHWGQNYFISKFNGSLTWMPRNYVTLSVGHDKHFWGDGYRSLFLSSSNSPYSFASFSLHAWRLKYIALWAHLPDIDMKSGNTNLYGKYGSFHLLSVNLTNRLNFSFFESVISRDQDSITNRGIEWSYLNPFVFYRSVEFSLRSPDNALMGGSMKLRLWKKTYLYGQLFLDDLMVKELFSNKGWYGNKIALQAGYKTYNLFNIPKLFLQQEINYIRPYTYGHSESMRNYGVYYQPLAHPAGANLQEFITSMKYVRKDWFFSGFVSFLQAGMDFSDVNYGQNIYKNPARRPGNFGVSMLQGKKTNNLICHINANYCIHKKWQSYLFVSGYYRHTGLTGSDNVLFSMGIKTLLFNENIDW